MVLGATQNLPQIYTPILRICMGKVAGFAVYICGNIWATQSERAAIVSMAIYIYNYFDSNIELETMNIK